MKTFKHLFTALMLLCATVASAHDFEVDGIYYKITNRNFGYVAVTYKGSSSSSDSYSGSVTIPKEVTYNGVIYIVKSIGEEAFRSCKELTNVTIPYGVTSIEKEAFLGCSGLTRITIPSSVTVIKDYAFQLCTGITSLTIPNNVKRIEYAAFIDCTALEEVTIPNSVTYIGARAFSYCSKLEKVNMGNGVTTIDDYAFYQCPLKEITLSNTLTTIGKEVFLDCRFTNITLPSSVTTIGDGAFYMCKELTGINIPNSVTAIPDRAFYNCDKLNNMLIGDGVKSIGNEAFYDCDNLKKILIGSGVNSIADNAFSMCDNLKLVINSSSLSFTKPHYYTDVIKVTDPVVQNGFVFDNKNNVLISYFGNGTNLSLPTYLNGKTYSIGDKAFSGSSEITTIILSNYTTGIGSGAFEGCTGLTSIKIPGRVTTIESSAFSGCSNLADVTISSGVATIGSNAFYNCISLAKVVLPNSIKTIDGQAFYGCSSLTSITIPNSVTNIGSYAFYGCKSLANVEIGSFVETIGSYAFYNCASLTSVEIPNSVTSIGSSAFHGCTNLNTVYNFSALTFTKGSTSNGYIAYYAQTVVNAPNGSIEGDFVFAVIDGVNTLLHCNSVSSVSLDLKDWTSTNKTNNSSSSNTYTILAKAGDILSFDWMVSSERGYDIFTVTINGTKILEKSGNETGNYKYTFPSDGVYKLIAKYSKDDSDKNYNDCGKIYNIKFSGVITVVDIVLPENYKGENYMIGAEAFKSSNLGSITIPAAVTGIGDKAFYGCTSLVSITSNVSADDLFALNSSQFNGVDKTKCTLYVPYGAKNKYAATAGWNEFTNIVETAPTEVVVTINQYGSATYCSPFALDFSGVEGLKAYAATGYNTATQVITLTRVQTAKEGAGLFIMGEPGEYTVPVIEHSNDYTLNLLVGTLERTTVNATTGDGNYMNFKYTVKSGDNTPMFYQFEDNSTLSAGKAYLQLPAVLFPSTASKSVSVRFDDGETTDIDEPEGDSEMVKTIYDLQGRVVENPTNGVYIIDGKKVFIKK